MRTLRLRPAVDDAVHGLADSALDFARAVRNLFPQRRDDFEVIGFRREAVNERRLQPDNRHRRLVDDLWHLHNSAYSPRIETRSQNGCCRSPRVRASSSKWTTLGAMVPGTF